MSPGVDGNASVVRRDCAVTSVLAVKFSGMTGGAILPPWLRAPAGQHILILRVPITIR